MKHRAQCQSAAATGEFRVAAEPLAAPLGLAALSPACQLKRQVVIKQRERRPRGDTKGPVTSLSPTLGTDVWFNRLKWSPGSVRSHQLSITDPLSSSGLSCTVVPQVVGTVDISSWEVSSFSGCTQLSAFPLPRMGLLENILLRGNHLAGLELIILDQASLEPMLCPCLSLSGMKRLARNVNHLRFTVSSLVSEGKCTKCVYLLSFQGGGSTVSVAKLGCWLFADNTYAGIQRCRKGNRGTMPFSNSRQ